MFNEPTQLVEKLPPGQKIPGSWYDADYYAGSPKSNWDKAYTWENYMPTFAAWAEFVLSAFPESRSFLDVGCAKGFLGKALLSTVELNQKPPIEYRGFDISPEGIAGAVKEIKPFLTCSSVDDYVFDRRYEVMLCLDMIAHLTEEQSEAFLRRSRPFIDDCGIFVIELDTPENHIEPSHITLRSREWWHGMFNRTGWTQNDELREFQEIAQNGKFVNNRFDIFIYGTK